MLCSSEKRLFDEISNKLSCYLCSKTYDNPHTLPCSHTYCSGCIRRYLNKNDVCPQCSLSYQPRDVVKARFLESIVLAYQAFSTYLETAEVSTTINRKENQDMQQPSSANIEQLSTYKIPGSINEQSNPPKYESSSSSSFSTTISFQQRTSEDHPQVVNSSSPNTGDLRSTASDSQQTVSPSHDIDKILSDGSRTMCPTPQINDEVNSTSDQDTVFNGRISPEVVHSMDSNMGVTSGADNISIVHFPRSFVDSDLYDAYTPKSPIASDNESTDLIRNRKRPAGYDFEIDENKVERSLDDRDGLVQSTYHNQLRSGVPLDYALCETVPLDVVLSDQEV